MIVCLSLCLQWTWTLVILLNKFVNDLPIPSDNLWQIYQKAANNLWNLARGLPYYHKNEQQLFCNTSERYKIQIKNKKATKGFKKLWESRFISKLHSIYPYLNFVRESLGCILEGRAYWSSWSDTEKPVRRRVWSMAKDKGGWPHCSILWKGSNKLWEKVGLQRFSVLDQHFLHCQRDFQTKFEITPTPFYILDYGLI